MEGRQARAAPGPALTELWEQRWPGCPPAGYKLRTAHRERWVRFHSLPESRRHPGDESEYAVVLDRYNTVLDALFAGGDVYVITPVWSTDARRAGPDARPVRRLTVPPHRRSTPGQTACTGISRPV
ncbi:hypothetical protein ACFW42_06475 [Streptomyces albidoflavus]